MTTTTVLLIPPESPELFQLVTGWLGRRENYQWLEFHDARPQASREWLKVAMHRQTAVLRVFTSDREYKPIGVVGFNKISSQFGSANIWVVLGDKAYARQGYATRALSRLLTHGFAELGLRSINAWTVEQNVALEIVRRLGFRSIGRQRQCHCIDGRPFDRLWFDLLANEHKELHDERRDDTQHADRAVVL